MRAHVASVAHAKQHRAGGAVLVFVHFTGRVDDESTGRDRDGFGRRPHGAAAGKAEIDFGGLRVAMIGTDLSGLPAGNGDIAIGDFAKDLLDVMPGVPLLFAFKAEDVHGRAAPVETGFNLAQGLAGQERVPLRISRAH
jgi:hypothetical protein